MKESRPVLRKCLVLASIAKNSCGKRSVYYLLNNLTFTNGKVKYQVLISMFLFSFGKLNHNEQIKIDFRSFFVMCRLSFSMTVNKLSQNFHTNVLSKYATK